MAQRKTSQRPPAGASAPEEPSLPIAPGVVVDARYRIVSHLGEGGMGTVLIAEHVGLDRKVALKLLQDRIGDDPTTRKRFQREARTLAAMSHPNIVALNDYGIWERKPYLVMELLTGRTLRELLDAEPVLPLARALGIVQQVLRALAYAHSQGAIHRDLKPGNVFLQALPDQIDHVKLLDFGFAKFVHKPASSFVSADGIVIGTPAYMAPEQAGGTVDHRADVYAGGVLLFEMLSGRRPFEGEPLEMIRGRLTLEAPTLAEVRPGYEFAPELEAVLARALMRRPDDRFQSASELSAALARVPPGAVMPAGAARGARRSLPQPPRAAPTEEHDDAELEERASDPPPRRRSRGRVLFLLVMLLGAVGGTAYAEYSASLLADPSFDPLARARSWLARRATAGPAHEIVLDAEHAAPDAPPAAAHQESEVEGALVEPETSGAAALAPGAEPPSSADELPAIVDGLAPPLDDEALALASPEPILDQAAAEGATAIAAAAPDAPAAAEPAPPIAEEQGPEVATEIASPEAPPDVTEDAPPEATDVAPPQVAPTTAAGPPDPWARDVPPALLALRARVDGSRAPSPADLRRIASYARSAPGDARAVALLAHGYVRTRWMSEALERYAEAHAVDPEVRGDPRMRENLVALSASAVVGPRASELTATIYGLEALPAIDAALAAGGLDAAATRRLRALREAIAARAQPPG